jgi:hypothetical protein
MNLLGKIKGTSCGFVGFVGCVDLTIPTQLVVHYPITMVGI